MIYQNINYNKRNQNMSFLNNNNLISNKKKIFN